MVRCHSKEITSWAKLCTNKYINTLNGVELHSTIHFYFCNTESVFVQVSHHLQCKFVHHGVITIMPADFFALFSCQGKEKFMRSEKFIDAQTALS